MEFPERELLGRRLEHTQASWKEGHKTLRQQPWIGRLRWPACLLFAAVLGGFSTIGGHSRHSHQAAVSTDDGIHVPSCIGEWHRDTDTLERMYGRQSWHCPEKQAERAQSRKGSSQQGQTNSTTDREGRIQLSQLAPLHARPSEDRTGSIRIPHGRSPEQIEGAPVIGRWRCCPGRAGRRDAFSQFVPRAVALPADSSRSPGFSRETERAGDSVQIYDSAGRATDDCSAEGSGRRSCQTASPTSISSSGTREVEGVPGSGPRTFCSSAGFGFFASNAGLFPAAAKGSRHARPKFSSGRCCKSAEPQSYACSTSSSKGFSGRQAFEGQDAPGEGPQGRQRRAQGCCGDDSIATSVSAIFPRAVQSR